MKKRVDFYLNNLLVSYQSLDYYNEEDFQFKIEEAKKIIKGTIVAKMHPTIYCEEENCNITHSIVS